MMVKKMVKLPSRTKGPRTPIVEEIATDKVGEMSEIRVDFEALEHNLGKRDILS